MSEKIKAKRSQKKGAKEILRLGQKALDYRRDILSSEQVDGLETSLKELREVLGKKLILIDELEEKAEKVDLELKKSGGLYYHKKGWVENIEMLMVAAIVVIGIRSFFLQPFIIPTNSMYPSFFGMQPNLYEEDNEVPNLLERSVDKVLLGASHYRLNLESSGNLYLVLQNGGSFRYANATFPNGRFFVFPSTVKEYVFEVGGKEHTLQVPAEFDFDTQLLTGRETGWISGAKSLNIFGTSGRISFLSSGRAGSPRLKSVTHGYGSMDYDMADYVESSLVRMEILVNAEPVDAFSTIVHKDKAENRGRALCSKLKDILPRQLFKIALQAAVGGKFIARETISAMRKDVTAKCYGGDISRKRKLLEKQKEGKKRMKQIGNVNIPQEAFVQILKSST